MLNNETIFVHTCSSCSYNFLNFNICKYFFFDKAFQNDYYSTIKKEYLRNLLTDIDDIHFQISKIYIKNQFEDIANIVFFKLYFGELISLGLLDDNISIFPNVSNLTEEIYHFVDLNLILDGANSIFGIPSDLASQYIDERNDSFADLAKIYFYFEPLVSYEAYLCKTYINQTFLIAYKLDDNSPNIEGEELYFNLPRREDDYYNNFYPYNNLISPKASNVTPEESKLINDSFYFQNWFVNKDYVFRLMANENFDMIMNFLHLNINNEGTLNKTTIVSLQSYFKNLEGKRIIIDVVFFINQKKFMKNDFDHSVFILLNDSSSLLTKEKYSDNQTFLISQNDVIEMALSSVVSEYFHYGLISNDYNFYEKGVFFDNIDINRFSEPSDYYNTIKGFNFDIRYFSPFYLYAKLFQRTSFISNYSEEEYIYTYFFNDSVKIKEICEQYNFSLYKTYITSNNINCLDRKNLLFYNKKYSENSMKNEVTLPFCICLPLYCIKNIEENFDNDEIEYVDNITLPEKCHNNLKFYENKIIDNNIKEEKTIDLSNISLKIGNSENQLEDKFIQFSYQKFELIGGLNFLLITLVDNNSLKIILNNFNDEMQKIRLFFIIIISVGIGLLIIGAYILVLINIYRIANIIYQYKKKLNNYTMQMQSKITNLTDLNNNTNFLLEQNNNDNHSLIPKEQYDKFNNEDNSLINELFALYCSFNKLSEEIFLHITNKIRKEIR